MIGKIKEKLEFARFRALHLCAEHVIRQWQEEKLRALLKHARLNVPMWRDILSKTNLDVTRTELLDSIHKIPLTNKDTYIGKMFEEYVDNHLNFKMKWMDTSGTSGRPFRIFKASQYINTTAYADFSELRFLLWRGWKYKDLSTTKIARIKQSTFSGKYRLVLHFMDFWVNPEKALSTIGEFKPEILISFPSVLLEMAKIIKECKEKIPLSPLFVISSGETLTAHTRAYISELTGAEIYNRYALEEIGVVGTECERHDGFHINSESLIVEITDENGKPLQKGKSGKVVITDLLNYNMPFIRYDTGDWGIISDEACVCGLNTPRVWIDGRYSLHVSINGKRFHALQFDETVFKFMNHILQYQVAKINENEVCIRIVPGPFFKKETEEEALAALSHLLGGGINIYIDIVTHINKTPRGKCQILTDETIPASTSVNKIIKQNI